jgi:23S rRNA (uracil1939-C5)-methyltransferase
MDSHYDLTIQRLVWRGRGLAQLETGQVVLVSPGVFPGERVRVHIVQAKSDYLQASWTEILDPHPLRRAHPCFLADKCGGCRFGWLPQREQLNLKIQVLENEIHRALPSQCTAHLPSIQAVSGPKQWRYRWRGQVHVQQGQPFVMPMQGHAPIFCSDCLLLAKPLSRQVHRLCADAADGRRTLAASPVTHQVAKAGDNVLLDLPLPAFELNIQVPPDVFFQAHWSGNQLLVNHVCSFLNHTWRVGDLYAGAGNFALPLGKQGNRVVAVESDPIAVQSGQENARRLGLDNVRFVRRNLARESVRRRLEKEGVQAVIVDPPRTGAGKKLAQTLDLPRLQRMVWVSCDVVNTCRDLKSFLARGWKIRQITVFDLFPQTWHVETVFVLDRDKA